MALAAAPIAAKAVKYALSAQAEAGILANPTFSLAAYRATTLVPLTGKQSLAVGGRALAPIQGIENFA